MPRLLKLFTLTCIALAVNISIRAQASGTAAHLSPDAALRAAQLAESGQCSQALQQLSTAVEHITDKTLQKRVGLDGARCATVLQRWDSLQGFLRVLNREFPRDPEVLYISIHAFSDLSTRAAQELARTAPDSSPALELDAEVNELQGKWDRAEADYRKILKSDPRYPGIHFRLARLLLSRPSPPADFREQATKELEQELEIDPANAGAEYVLGELALQARQFDQALAHLTKATHLSPDFGDAYLGLGVALSGEGKYAEAIAPLQTAVKLEPSNPAAYYTLGTAYSRTGRKAEAEQEFARQQAIQSASAQGNQSPQ